MLQAPVLPGGINTNPLPGGSGSFGNFSEGYMRFGFPVIFALPSIRTVFIQNVSLVNPVFL